MFFGDGLSFSTLAALCRAIQAETYSVLKPINEYLKQLFIVIILSPSILSSSVNNRTELFPLCKL